MARPAKKVEEKKFDIDKNEIDLQHLWNERIQDTINAMNETIANLQERVFVLEKICTPSESKSINKVEKFNDEVPSTIESYNGMKMDASDKIISMQNAIKILPPNMVVSGRHLKQNVEAIVGFKVSDEMMDEAYEGLEK